MYAGIDEAGYGPMLGPLCIGQSALSISNWSPGEKAPDLWGILQQAVGKSKRDAKTKIAVGDSKNLKLANSSVTQHPLVHLERAVLAFLGARDGEIPTTDIQLFDQLGANLEDQPWYQGKPIELPLGTADELLGVDVSFLNTIMRKHQVELIDLRVQIIDVSEFNEIYQAHRSKAAATERGLVNHLERINRHATEFDHTRVVCDRQSGRTRYLQILDQIFEGLVVHEESPRASRYSHGDELGILLTPKADDAYFPVALASMAAKLVRELAMMRFNRYWSARQAELKPTAGYVQDARRWLNDTKQTVTVSERQAMIRLA